MTIATLTESSFDRETPQTVPFEVIDSKELARRLVLPESWVRDHVRGRCDDPIPHIKVGRYIRFEWGSRELLEWWSRHRVTKQGMNGGG
jgi:hypothetical protein